MCGCGTPAPIGGGMAATYAAPVQQAPVQQAALGGGPTMVPGQTLSPQANVNDGSIRNQQLAELNLARLKDATKDIDTPEKARAAGYRPNPTAPDHWINDDVFAVRNGYDLSRPATIMFEGNQLVGVMLSHDPKQGAPPDLGAGAWHTHFSDDEYAAHVWFTKPIGEAFGTETGNI